MRGTAISPAAALQAPCKRSAPPTLTWTGGDSSNNWSAPGNWVGPDTSENQVTPQAGDDLIFAGSTRLANTNDTAAGTAYDSITFSSGGFTITGNTLTITSGITANNAVGTTDSLNVAVTFSTSAPGNRGQHRRGGIEPGGRREQ